jgi:hypothetical protein
VSEPESGSVGSFLKGTTEHRAGSCLNRDLKFSNRSFVIPAIAHNVLRALGTDGHASLSTAFDIAPSVVKRFQLFSLESAIGLNRR